MKVKIHCHPNHHITRVNKAWVISFRKGGKRYCRIIPYWGNGGKRAARDIARNERDTMMMEAGYPVYRKEATREEAGYQEQ